MPRLTIWEAETYLGVTRRTLYRCIGSGELRAVMNSGTGRIQFEEHLKRLRDRRSEWVEVVPAAKKRKPTKKS